MENPLGERLSCLVTTPGKTKAHQTEAAAPWLRATTGAGTRAVVVLQNGVEHEERTRPFVGTTPILPTTVLCAAEAIAPGRIRHHGFARLEVPSGPLAEELTRHFAGADAEIVALDDMKTALWQKLLRSVTANTREDAAALLRLAAEIPIRTHTVTYPLAEATAALVDLKQDRVRGAAVLLP